MEATLRRSKRVQERNKNSVEEEDQVQRQRTYYSINQDVDNFEESPTFLENEEGKHLQQYLASFTFLK